MTISGEIVKADEKLAPVLATLQERLSIIPIITTQDQHREVGAIKLDTVAYIKSVGFELDPGILKAKEVVRHLEQQKAKFVDPAKKIKEVAEERIADANRRERLAAEAETARKNEELRVEAARKAAELKREADERAAEERRRQEVQAEADRKERARLAEIERKEEEKRIAKAREEGVLNKREAEKLAKEATEKAAKEKQAAEEEAARKRKEAEEDEARRKRQADEEAKEIEKNVQSVEVLANRPIIKGIRGGGNWEFEMVNEDELMSAFTQGDSKRRLYLRSFIKANDVEIRREVKRIENKEEAEKAIPGILVNYRDR